VTATIARLILAMLILPATAAVGLLGLIIVAARNSGGPPTPGNVLALWVVVYTFVAAYWVLLWRSTVRWTRARVRNTALAGLIAVAGAGAFAGTVVTVARAVPVGIAMLLGGGLAPIVWVLATVLLWRETPAERVARMSGLAVGGRAAAVCCPICGYDLSGLREARCPECGGTFTLDALVASQPQRDEHPAEL
jgi:hypothetical protein